MTGLTPYKFDAAFRLAGRGLVLLGCLVVFAIIGYLTQFQAITGFTLLAFVLGWFSPWKALVALAILGPLSLLGPGSTHRLIQLDVVALGALAGDAVRGLIGSARVRRWRSLGVVGGARLCDAAEDRDPIPPPPAGWWAAFGWVLAFGVVASALPGFQISLATPAPMPAFNSIEGVLAEILCGYPTWPWWSIHAIFNWGTGLLLCGLVYRRATPERVRELLFYAGGAVAVACLIGLGSWFGLWSLDEWRRPNYDFFLRRFQRLTGLAGHAGWMAEWIIVAWPGLLLLWGPGWKRKALATVLLSVVALTLLLTMARAAWLGVGLAVLVLPLLHLRSLNRIWKPALAALGVGAVLVGLSLLVAPEGLVYRLRHLADFRDRLNYVASTIHLWNEAPFGLGIGLHSLYYDAWFAPFHRFWQYDHATAHNTWLHTLVEQGPFQTAFVAVGAMGIVVAAWRGWRRADVVRKPLLLALLLGMVGLAAESMAQYLPLLRAVELMIWIQAGCILRLSRDGGMRGVGGEAAGVTPGTRGTQGAGGTPGTQGTGEAGGGTAGRGEAGEKGVAGGRRWIGAAFLVAGGIPAIAVALHHARHDAAHPYPRALVVSEDGKTVETWTTPVWRIPLEPDWCGVEFNLIATRYSQDIEILLPDNAPYRAHFEPGEQRGHWFALRPSVKPATPFSPLRWMEIRSARPWTPALSDPGAEDRRVLGIYVFGFHPFYCDDDPNCPPAQTWKESVGGMVPMTELPPGSVSGQGS